MAFFHNQDPYFPRLHKTVGVSHKLVSYPFVKRNDEDVFQLVLDVNGFDPNELSLKLDGRELLIKGIPSRNRKTQNSCFQRKFCWRLTLPRDVDLKSIKARLSKPTTLEIEVKKIKENERYIRIDYLDSLGDQAQRNSETSSRFDDTRSLQRQDNNVKIVQEMDEATVEVVPDDNLDTDSP
ncbi:heat shock protein 23-like [Stylophora pistillata]|uniref:heat shock protein 23-like n=1 Tax=Stylophora pistillata TaxID=50429 RepID=UPI000C04AD8C|nr:heat shock protein 23-like [Stylophora pistillata]